jgi:D-serine deaminase-like pyridoxal phosphate-dependent protein
MLQILYGFPLPLDKIGDLALLQSRVERVTVMIDSVLQVRGLAKYAKEVGGLLKFRAFIKIDQGGS